MYSHVLSRLFRISVFSIFLSGAIQAAADTQPSALATADQREVEALAIRLLASPELKKQKEITRQRFLADPIAKTPDGKATLQKAVDELAYVMALGAANGDPARPKVVWYFTAPRVWMGHDVPGSRWGFDNPDNVYRFATVDGKSRYEITVHPTQPEPVQSSYMLFDSFAGDNTKQRSIWLDEPIAALLDRQIRAGADGSFKITVDSDPANGRANHIQSNADARILMIRNSFTDWRTQSTPQVEIRRIAGPKAPKPASDKQLALRAAFLLKSGTDFLSRLNYNAFGVMPFNVLTKPWIRGGGHGMSSIGKFDLADDEALLVTVDPLGGKYLGFDIADIWTVSREHIAANGSLNNYQALANPDGSYTYVISAQDPGINNWLDTDGLHQGTIFIRWQGLPAGIKFTENAVREAKVVKLNELPRLLPAETATVTAEQRQAHYAQRTLAYAHRYAPE